MGGGVKPFRLISRGQLSSRFLSDRLAVSPGAQWRVPVKLLLRRRRTEQESGPGEPEPEGESGNTGAADEVRTARTGSEEPRPAASEGVIRGSTRFSSVMKEGRRRGSRGPSGVSVSFFKQGGAAAETNKAAEQAAGEAAGIVLHPQPQRWPPTTTG